MKHTAPIAQASQRLTRSCHQLGLWPLAFDSTGQPVMNEYWAALSSAAFQQCVGQIVRAWLEDPNAAQPEPIGPGVYLVPGVCPRCVQRLGVVAGLTVDPVAQKQGACDQWFTQQGIDHTTISRTLQHCTQHYSSDLNPAHRAMSVFAEQAIDAAVSEQAVEEFCERLDHAYDEVKLMYRLAELFNDSRHAGQSFQAMCQMILDFCPFAWVSAVFFMGNGTDELAKEPIVCGECPLSKEEIEQQAQRVRLLHGPQQDCRLLRPSDDQLAHLVNAEVFSFRVHREGRAVALLLAGNKTGPDPEVSSIERQLLQAASNYMGVFHQNTARYAEQRRLFFGSLTALSRTIEAKDPYTCGHSERVAELSAQLAAAIGWDAERVERVRISGLVHDVGKIGIPEAILCKPGRPTDEEFDRIRAHPVIGYNILKEIPDFADVLDGVLYHHERWDGRGYPEKLSGDRTPLIARIMAVADTFDAMSSSRSYRKAMDRDAVFAEIRRCAGSQFDPELVEPFLTMDFSRFDELIDEHRDEKLWLAA